MSQKVPRGQDRQLYHPTCTCSKYSTYKHCQAVCYICSGAANLHGGPSSVGYVLGRGVGAAGQPGGARPGGAGPPSPAPSHITKSLADVIHARTAPPTQDDGPRSQSSLQSARGSPVVNPPASGGYQVRPQYFKAREVPPLGIPCPRSSSPWDKASTPRS